MNLPDFFLKPGTQDPDPRKLAIVGGPLVLVVVLLAVVFASGGGEPPPTTSTTTSIVAAPTTTTVAGTTTTAATSSSVWPLTGLARPDSALPDPNILIAKIDNTANARPQLGLDSADMVIEVIVEGGVARLLAFFQSDLPPEVGPIRSVREVDPKLIEPFGALMAHSGGQSHVIRAVDAVATDVGQPALGSSGYYRDPNRPGTYDLILRTADVVGSTPPVAPSSGWLAFGDVPSGTQALTVELAQSNANLVNYRYSGTDGGYLRFIGDTPHEAQDAGQLVATNVVVVFVPEINTGRVDSAGSSVPDYEVTGAGAAVVFRDGVAVEGRWQRATTSAFFSFVDGSGVQIPLAPGQTWIELTPVGRSLEWQ